MVYIVCSLLGFIGYGVRACCEAVIFAIVLQDESDFFMLPTEATPLANSSSRPLLNLYDVVAENDSLSLKGDTAEICDVKV